MTRFLSIVSLSMVFGCCVADETGHAQTRPSRPALIRDTETAEGKDEEEASKEKPFNPLLAEKSVKIGDFYFKKKNYAAAIQRYLEAISFQPNLITAYEGLARSYEKDGKREKAIEVYRDFMKKYPESKKSSEFSRRAATLEKQP